MVFALLSLLTFISALAVDFAEARYILAIGDGCAHLAARWSLAIWALGCLGFVAVVNYSLWLMLPEGLGFYLGTILAVQMDVRSAVKMPR